MSVRVVSAERDPLSEALDNRNAGVTPEPGSVVDRLRRRALAGQRERRLDLDVPGWRGELVLRFRPLDMGQAERFMQARSGRSSSEVSEGVESMAQCCVGVFGRDGDRLEELGDEAGPVLLEHRLIVLLGLPIPPDAKLSTREVVDALFFGNAIAIGEFIDRLVGWMRDPDAAESVGESSGSNG